MNNSIDTGGDGRSYSIKVNNETVYAYCNGKDVTEDFNKREESAKKAIIRCYAHHEIEFITFCHLGNTGDMTVEIIVDGCRYYTILWKEGKISSVNYIEEKQ